MHVVCFGQQNWDVCWTEKQHLMTRLARRGHRVLYVDPDRIDACSLCQRTTVLSAGSMGDAGLVEWAPGMHVLTQFRIPSLPHRIQAKLRLLQLRRVCRELQLLDPVAFSLRPDRAWLMRAINPSAMVYYAVDEWTGFGGLSDSDRQALRRQEEALLREVDVALGVSPRLVERFGKIQPASYRLENGADVDHFSPQKLSQALGHPILLQLRGPKIGFVGQIDERLDQQLLLQMAEARPSWQIVLAGRVKIGVDVSALAGSSRIHLLGFQEYEKLPGILRDLDVCLVPYRPTELTQSCNPSKVYEYLAADRPVVSRPLEGLVICRDAISFADSAEDFIRAVDAALADPRAGRDRRREIVQQNSWEQRTDAIEAYLAEAQRRAAQRRAQQGRERQPDSVRGRRAAAIPVKLDLKDESVRRYHGGYQGLGPKQRLLRRGIRLLGWGYYGGRLIGRATMRLAGDRRPIRVRKILIVRHGFLGDTIALLPSLEALRRTFPHARIVLGVQPRWSARALVESSGLVDEILEMNLTLDWRRRIRWRGILRLLSSGYDLLIAGVSYSIPRDALFAAAPRQIGLYDGHPHQEMLDRVVPLDPTRHEVDNLLSVVELLSGQIPPEQRAPRLFMDPAKIAAANERLRMASDLPENDDFFIVHPGSARPSRRWPAEHYAQLTTNVLEQHRHLHAVFTGTPAEAELVDSIIAQLPLEHRTRAHSSVGSTDLSMLIAMVDAARLVVCNDTGIMHLSRARGTPLVAVLGPENDLRWGPYELGAAPAIGIRAEVPCAPCGQHACDKLYCMRATPVEKVRLAVERLLKETHSLDPASIGARRRAVRLPVLEQPAPADHRTERQLTRWSCVDLAEAGFHLPLVSVVLWAEEPDREIESLRQAIQALRGQSYPNVEAVVLRRTGGSERVNEELRRLYGSDSQFRPALKSVRISPHDASDSVRLLQAAMPQCAGEFVFALGSLLTCSADRIGLDVAGFLRGPKRVDAVRDGEIAYVSASAADVSVAADACWRREALAKLLPQRIPSHTEVEYEELSEPFINQSRSLCRPQKEDSAAAAALRAEA